MLHKNSQIEITIEYFQLFSPVNSMFQLTRAIFCYFTRFMVDIINNVW